MWITEQCCRDPLMQRCIHNLANSPLCLPATVINLVSMIAFPDIASCYASSAWILEKEAYLHHAMKGCTESKFPDLS